MSPLSTATVSSPSIASSWATVASDPGSLMSVCVSSSGSTTLRLVRVSPDAAKAQTSMPPAASREEIFSPTEPPRSARARLLPPSLAMTFETLIPFPPGSSRRSVMRFTASRANRGTVAVLSSAGLSVTV